MASTLVKIYVHLVFHIKNSSIKMREEDLNNIFSYIGGIIKNIGGYPIVVGGRPDHIHILTSLPKMMSLAEFVRTIKANSSKWIKMQDNIYRVFAWQEGYGAFSVSPSLIEKTVNYIQRQEQHHKKRSFQEEYRLFLEAYGIKYDEHFTFVD
ncbi:MAG: transposase [Prevotella sp.]|nr:transposase [Prevotella sp.]